MEPKKENLKTTKPAQTLQPDVSPTGVATEQTPPVPPTPSIPSKPPKKNWALIVGIIVLVLAVLFGGGVWAYQNYFTKKAPVSIESSPTQTPASAANKFYISDDPAKSGWKMARGTYFSISFPSDWVFLSPTWSDNKFPETVSIQSPTDASTIKIGTKYSFPYGGPLGEEEKESSISVVIGDQSYKTIETLYGESINAMYSSFAAIEIPEDIVVFEGKSGGQSKQFKEPLYIMFGNSYPAGGASKGQNLTNPKYYYDQYIKEKPTILQIFSTFKFLGQTDSDNSNWKTYTNKALSFKYPAHWMANGPFVLTGISPSIRIAASENSTLMNECMQETSVENKTGFVLRNFKRVVTGEACSGGDASELETWVVKSVDLFGPGIIITYSANDSALANPIINNILSTFKFTQ